MAYPKRESLAKDKQYNAGKHCVFYHRYHIVWSSKYRHKVLTGALRVRVRGICRQVCAENEVQVQALEKKTQDVISPT